MRLFLAAAAVLMACACTPTYNWREVAVGPGLHATFPCKPDKAEHRAAFAPGREVLLHAVGCEAGGAAFVVVYGDVAGAEIADTLSQWKQASLATLKATVGDEKRYQPAGGLELAQSVMVRAEGRKPDGKAVQSQAAYFARGGTVFQAAVHAPQLKAEMTEPFFAGLRFE